MRYVIILPLTILLFSCQKLSVNEMIHQKTENISAFAKLYGYVRFFYPGDEAAKLDWDKFAVYGVQYVEEAGSAAELKQKLIELFTPVAPLLKIYEKNETVDDKPFIPSDTSKMSVIVYKHFGVGGINDNSIYNIYKSVRSINKSENDSGIFKSVRQYPQPGELFKADLSQSLSISMPLALYKDDIGTLPHTDSLKTAGFIDNVKSIIPAEYTANDKYVRLADVIICWNIFQHFYPYFDVVNVDWNSELHNALADAYKDNSEYEFLKTLKKFTAKLNDGHINVRHVSDIHNYYFPPFTWQWIENSLVITKVLDEAKGKLQIGDIVAEINDIAAAEALMNEEQYVSGATEQWKRNNYTYSGLDNSLMRLLSGEKDTQMKLKIKRDDEIITIIVKRTNMKVNITDNSPNIEEKQPGIYYIDLTRTDDKEFNTYADKLKNAKGIIFDMRGYPGKISPVFIQHLITDNVKSAQWMIPINLYPDQSKTEYNSDGIWDLKPLTPHFSAKIAFITDGRAISYAESIMGIVEYYKLGEIIGEPTAGTNGNINLISLPGGYNITWTGMKVIKHDSSRHHGVGIQPTIPFPRTIQSIKEGKDLQLEKAIEVVSK